MDKKFCDCCDKEIKDNKELVLITFHDEHLRRSRELLTFPQGRDLCLNCYKKIGEMVHIEIPQEPMLDILMNSMKELGNSFSKVLTGGRDENIEVPDDHSQE